MKRLLSVLLLATFLLSTASSQQYTIKFGTLAPEGSSWMNIMREFDTAVRKESGGKMGFKIYAGGVQGGDEKAMLRKIKIGQLHSGGFTGVGLGEIAPRIRVLDTPFLFRNHAEVDHIYQEFDKEFQQAFEEGGYILLGWAEVGFVYVFTSTVIKKPDDLKGIRMWTWEGDPIAETAFRTLGINPIALSFDNVLTSLQTGLIDAFYTSPYAATVLQWYTRVKYMVDVPIADASGAVLVSKKEFDTYPKEFQEILIRNGRTYMAKLTQASRQENKKAIEEIRKRGITVLNVDEKDLSYYIQAGGKARRMLVGRLYSENLLNRVEQAVADFRKNSKAAK